MLRQSLLRAPFWESRLLLGGGHPAAPMILSASHVEAYQRDGYVVVEGALDTSNVSPLFKLTAAVRNAAVERGDRYVPETDRELEHSNVELKTQMKQATVHSERHTIDAVSDRGLDAVGFERREKKIKIRCRSQKDIDRAYEKLSTLRKKYTDYKHMDVKGKDSVGISPPIPTAATGEKLFSTHPDDEIDVNSFGKEQAQKAFDDYQKSGKLERDIRKGSHLDDALDHVKNCAKSWSHVAATNKTVREGLFQGPSSIASLIGAAAAQLTATMTVRLYTDVVVQRSPLCNGTPFHLDASGINYRDPRGLQATMCLPRLSGSQTNEEGGFVVLPGSHRVIDEITSSCRDLTSFIRPAAWDIGESIRPFPELTGIRPRLLGPLPPGSILFLSNMLVYANQASFTLPAQRVSTIDEGVLTYSLSIMPDGVTFDGCRNTWMSKDSHGPLYKMEAGQPLRDEAQFPVLFSELD